MVRVEVPCEQRDVRITRGVEWVRYEMSALCTSKGGEMQAV